MLFWQITVQPITKMSSKWKHLCLNVRHRDKDCFNITAMVTVNVWEMIKEIDEYIHYQCFLKIIQYIRQVTHWGWDKTGRHFADGVFEWIFLDTQDLIVFQIKLHWDWFHTWFTLLTHICVTRLNELICLYHRTHVPHISQAFGTWVWIFSIKITII